MRRILPRESKRRYFLIFLIFPYTSFPDDVPDQKDAQHLVQVMKLLVQSGAQVFNSRAKFSEKLVGREKVSILIVGREEISAFSSRS